ncbi:hypothetical protein HDU76_007268 [Blyttiomyces sp. JEL0837]|nr:hypothetical protein HDU76_007268 [Blyttiomyces sp. JEL0837]
MFGSVFRNVGAFGGGGIGSGRTVSCCECDDDDMLIIVEDVGVGVGAMSLEILCGVSGNVLALFDGLLLSINMLDSNGDAIEGGGGDGYGNDDDIGELVEVVVVMFRCRS